MSKALNIFTIENTEEEKILRTRSLPVTVEQLKSEDFKKFLEDLLYTAQHSEEQGMFPAGGIAAIQVGKPLQVFFSLNYDTDEWELFINPSIEPIGFLKTSSEEGCLSIPKKVAKVSRYLRTKIRYQDIDGKWITKKYSDTNAISIQHEFDHLAGILFIDRIEKV